MIEISRKKAPVSEVVLSANYEGPVLSSHSIFLLENILYKEFPNIELLAPIADESLSDHLVSVSLNLANTGQVLFRFRSNSSWLVQLQYNKIILNWIRSDDVSVEEGAYPGFDIIFDKFISLLDIIKKAIKINPKNGIKYLECAFTDRIVWPEYIDDLRDLNKIINAEEFYIKSNFTRNSISFREYLEVEELGGYLIKKIESGRFLPDRKILSVEFNLKGRVDGLSVTKWFGKARNLHYNYFSTFFTPETLNSWQ